MPWRSFEWVPRTSSLFRPVQSQLWSSVEEVGPCARVHFPPRGDFTSVVKTQACRPASMPCRANFLEKQSSLQARNRFGKARHCRHRFRGTSGDLQWSGLGVGDGRAPFALQAGWSVTPGPVWMFDRLVPRRDEPERLNEYFSKGGNSPSWRVQTNTAGLDPGNGSRPDARAKFTAR